jgi:glycerol-3-phosphate acyltransferase PlsX
VIKLVLDAMGGDHAPVANLEGAKLAVERGFAKPEQIVLAGPRPQLQAELQRLGINLAFDFEDAPDIVTCHDSPVEAMRTKPRNSIALGIAAVAQHRAHTFISAGSTGVVVAAASVGLARLEGIRRPGIAVTIKGEGGVPFVVIDVGANPQPKAIDLVHYAIMGSAYYRGALGNDKPRVGLLNIGSEDTKGNPLTREAGQMLREAPINFIGNVEGVDVFAGRCDVVVCDGFTGNVLLKVSEGCAEYVLRTTALFMKEAALDPAASKGVLRKLQQRVDFSEYGGAQLLGVDGVVTICHGRSGPEAICNAIRFAVRSVEAEVNQHIVAAARSAATS